MTILHNNGPKISYLGDRVKSLLQHFPKHRDVRCAWHVHSHTDDSDGFLRRVGFLGGRRLDRRYIQGRSDTFSESAFEGAHDARSGADTKDADRLVFGKSGESGTSDFGPVDRLRKNHVDNRFEKRAGAGAIGSYQVTSVRRTERDFDVRE